PRRTRPARALSNRLEFLTVRRRSGYRDRPRNNHPSNAPSGPCGRKPGDRTTMLLKRTHTCGDLTKDHVGHAVVLNGWVDAWRDFGGLVFIDLRDRYGVTQVVFEPDAGAELQARARDLRSEYVVGIKGTVAHRLPGKENPKLKTGAIEVRATELVLYNATPTPPFELHGPEPNEELRLKYRFLDLRRPDMQRIFSVRHRLCQLMRNVLSEQNFLEVETPFVEDQDVLSTLEFLVAAMAREFSGQVLTLPLPRIEYHDAMERFGSDRPDLRYGLELKDVAEIADLTEFKVLKQAREFGHRIRGFCAPKG